MSSARWPNSFQNCGESSSLCGLCLDGPSSQVPAYDEPPPLSDHNYTPPSPIDGTTTDALIQGGMISPVEGNGTLSGALTGTSTVTARGSFNYRIPFRVPPGVNGHTPEMGLEYSSDAGVGPVGVGWRIFGTSKIERCTDGYWTGRPKAVHFYDGQNWDDPQADALCLDGQRLVRKAPSDALSDVVEFEALVNDASKIRGYLFDGRFMRFRVWKKNGTVLTYSREHRLTTYRAATNEDSIETLAWHLTDIEDRSGNLIEILYSPDSPTSSAEFAPWLVRYAGGRFEIEFQYGTEMRPNSRCIGGTCLNGHPELREVFVRDREESLWSYHLQYQTSPLAQTQRLTHLMWCNGAGACEDPTEFAWQSVEDGEEAQFRLLWESDALGVHEQAMWTQPWLADFNGDGPVAWFLTK